MGNSDSTLNVLVCESAVEATNVTAVSNSSPDINFILTGCPGFIFETTSSETFPTIFKGERETSEAQICPF